MISRFIESGVEVVAIGLEAIVSSLLSPSLPVSVLGGGEVRPWTGTPIGPCHSPRAMSDDREVEAGIRSIRDLASRLVHFVKSHTYTSCPCKSKVYWPERSMPVTICYSCNYTFIPPVYVG